MFQSHLFSYFGVRNCFVWKRFATKISYDNMFHGFCSTRKCFQQRLISFRSVLSESDNLFVSSWSRTSRRFLTNQRSFVYRSEHTPLEKLIFFSRSMDKWKVNIFLARWKKLLLVSYFFFFWAKPLSFWEKLTIFAPTGRVRLLAILLRSREQK